MTGANYQRLEHTLSHTLNNHRNLPLNNPSSTVNTASFLTPTISSLINATNSHTTTVNALWLSDIHLGC